MRRGRGQGLDYFLDGGFLLEIRGRRRDASGKLTIMDEVLFIGWSAC
jgi:hypothetical protein